MKIICVGDNVVDCYIDKRKYYPGGNAVNVAVNALRYGAEKSAYLGIFGNDKAAKHIKNALVKEHVDFSYSREMIAPTCMPMVESTADGDRIFIGNRKDSAQHIVRLNLMPKDLEYIKQFDVCHTSLYSNIEPELKKLSKICKISFDYSDDFDMDFVRETIKYVNFAFFSSNERTRADLDDIIELCSEHKTEVLGITHGAEDVEFYKDNKLYKQGIKEAEVVDTMGAGDGFIAGFLKAYVDGESMEKSLDYAAECAAISCGVSGGFGYEGDMSDMPDYGKDSIVFY